MTQRSSHGVMQIVRLASLANNQHICASGDHLRSLTPASDSRHPFLMIEFYETDFVPLTEFSQRWRFADALYGYISPDLERRVRPLAVDRAAEVGAEALARDPAPSERGLDGVEFRTDGEPSGVRAWLRSLPVDPTSEVLVSWDAQTAVVTDWDVFVAYWDDFCHASSDDVTIWAPRAGWTLGYWHHEVFTFRSRPRAV